MPPDLIEAIKGLGAYGGLVFGILWWLERDERKESQKALLLLGERAFTALEGAKNTLDGFKTLLGSSQRSNLP